jgi:thiamine biosynthesis lipoprotein
MSAVHRPEAETGCARLFRAALLLLAGFLSDTPGLAEDLPQDRSLQMIAGRTMGTSFTVKFLAGLPGAPDQSRPKVEAEIQQLLETINRQMSTYLSDSELSRFNECQRTNWFPVSLEVAEVFQTARSISEASRGAFDITVGPLVNLWGFGPEKRPWQIPDADAIARLLPRVGYTKVAVQTNPPVLRKAAPEIYCDLSAIAKGYGVDRVVQYLETIRIHNYLVQIGGEVRAQGRNADGRIWRVGIQDPNDANRICRRVLLRDRALSTSGDYEQSFEEHGRRYSHTIDPRTGHPVTHGLASVSVIHRSSAMADAWATALNVLGPEEGFDLARGEQMSVHMILRTPDGLAEKMTSGFQELIVDPASL